MLLLQTPPADSERRQGRERGRSIPFASRHFFAAQNLRRFGAKRTLASVGALRIYFGSHIEPTYGAEKLAAPDFKIRA
jgi:hypothetical protein